MKKIINRFLVSTPTFFKNIKWGALIYLICYFIAYYMRAIGKDVPDSIFNFLEQYKEVALGVGVVSSAAVKDIDKLNDPIGDNLKATLGCRR
jgi:hypothetical protein